MHNIKSKGVYLFSSSSILKVSFYVELLSFTFFPYILISFNILTEAAAGSESLLNFRSSKILDYYKLRIH